MMPHLSYESCTIAANSAGEDDVASQAPWRNCSLICDEARTFTSAAFNLAYPVSSQDHYM